MKIYRLKIAIFVFVVVYSFASCGGGGSGSTGGNPCSDLNLRVTGGTQCKFERSPVVLIAAFDKDINPIGICTGTMVTVNDILTAAHCIRLALLPNFDFVAVFADDSAHAVISAAIHPLWNGRTGSPFDIAMLTIDSVLDISPVPLIVSNFTTVGEPITVYGYGDDGGGVSAIEIGPAALKAGKMKISAIAPGLIAGTFDDTGSSVCNGDSGGPVTQVIDGVVGIVGVTSFGTGGVCKSGSFAAFVDIQYQAMYEFILNYAPDVTVI